MNESRYGAVPCEDDRFGWGLGKDTSGEEGRKNQEQERPDGNVATSEPADVARRNTYPGWTLAEH